MKPATQNKPVSRGGKQDRQPESDLWAVLWRQHRLAQRYGTFCHKTEENLFVEKKTAA